MKTHILAVFLVCFPAISHASIASTANESNQTPGDVIVLLVKNAPRDHLAAARVDLTPVLQYAGIGPVSLNGIRASVANGQEVPFQFLPDGDFDPTTRVAGTALFKLPNAGNVQLRLEFTESPHNQESLGIVTVRTQDIEVKHRAWRTGGLPSQIKFLGSDTLVDGLVWEERAYCDALGTYRISEDPWGNVEKVAEGPWCTVVRVSACYMQANGARPPSRPESTYYWCYFHDLPLALVTVSQRQTYPMLWPTMRFLELHPGNRFKLWAGGNSTDWGQAPLQQGQLTGSESPYTFSEWAAISDGLNVFAFLDSGALRIYDGRGTRIGTYLLAHTDSRMAETHRERSAWLVVGSAEAPWTFAQTMNELKPVMLQATATTDQMHSRTEELRDELRQLSAADQRQAWWRAAAADQLQAQGRLDEALLLLDGAEPENWGIIPAGDMGLILESMAGGIHLLTLFDGMTETEFLAPAKSPLFSMTLRNTDSQEEVTLSAESGWNVARVEPTDDGSWLAKCQDPTDQRLSGIAVTLAIRAEQASSSLHLDIQVHNVPEPWSVRHVVFPQLALGEFDSETRMLVPFGPGRVFENVWRRPFMYPARYPSGGATMGFLAAYDRAGTTGLYLATHDPWASTRDVSVERRRDEHALVFSVDHPAPDMTRPGNGFELSGEAVWDLFHGDWFDAAVIYRDWVRKEAKWYPELSTDGREDTPLWMRELPAWIRTWNHALPEDDVTWAQSFCHVLDRPTGLRWYGWYDDASQYSANWQGFADAISRLQGAAPPVYVMPYTCGVYWIAGSNGIENADFASILRSGVVKNEGGELDISRSENGDLRAVMCPMSTVYQDRLKQIVMGVFTQYGAKAAYVDVVANTPPRFCFDSSHGHPTGGGHWWAEGYWEIFEEIRREMPTGCILTSESTAEPYIRVLDGLLTQWNSDKQVPAFPAVYGGAIQMFGRYYNYDSRPTKLLAHRMQAGQAFVFGEQTGGALRLPTILHEQESLDFLTQIARLRWELRRFFYAGEMTRPPQLRGSVPTLIADWRTDSGAAVWVTTDAVLTGAWRIPHEQHLALLFVNISDEPLTLTLDFDAAEYGLPQEQLKVTTITPWEAMRFGPRNGQTFLIEPTLQRELTFPPCHASAWLIEP